MILTQELRTSALTEIDIELRLLLEVSAGARYWPSIKSLADDGAKIAAATLDEEVDSDVEYLINVWADADVIKEARIAEMDQMLIDMEKDALGDDPSLTPVAVYYDLVQAVAINYERDAITAEWLRMKL